MMTRQEKILSCIVGTQLGTGIEPLNRLIVPREMGNIRYTDAREELVQAPSDEATWQVSSKVSAKKIQHNGYCWMFFPHAFFEQLKTLLLNLQLPQCEAVSFGNEEPIGFA